MVDSNAIYDLLGSINDFSGWEEEIAKMVFKAGQELAENLFSVLDEHLAETRDSKALRCIGFRARTLVTRFGEVTVKRRLYRDEAGNYRFLLDEALGLSKRVAASSSVNQAAATLAAHVPFRVASDLLSRLLPSGISHQSIHTLVGRMGNAAIEAQQREEEALFENGVLPEGERKAAETLYLEADGTTIALQREKAKRKEMKVGVAYTGKERGITKDKVIHMDIDESESFWRGLSTKVIKGFDSSKVAQVFVGGDGASWIRVGRQAFPGAIFRLDRFHVMRAIRRVLGFGKEASSASQAALKGKLSDAICRLEKAKEGKTLKEAKEVNSVIRYLTSNADGLGEGPSLGTIESNVDKLVANRMKKRGMSWSINGARRMAKLLELNFGGEIESFEVLKPAPLTIEAAASSVARKLGPNPQSWLYAHLPSLEGPHGSRPWAKALRSIVRGSDIHLSGIAPTKS